MVVYERARTYAYSLHSGLSISIDEGPNKHKAAGCGGQVFTGEWLQTVGIYLLILYQKRAHASYYHTPESMLLPQPWFCCRQRLEMTKSHSLQDRPDVQVYHIESCTTSQSGPAG